MVILTLGQNSDNISIGHGNIEYALKLIEMLVATGVKITDRQLNKFLVLSKKQHGVDKLLGFLLHSCVRPGHHDSQGEVQPSGEGVQSRYLNKLV